MSDELDNLVKEAEDSNPIDLFAKYPKKSIEEMESKKENKEIVEALKKCEDPELDLDIWSLGLVYDIIQRGKAVQIIMTFTSPMCPFGPQIVNQIKSKVGELGSAVSVEVVFNPVWKPSEEVKEMLGFAG